MFDHPFDYFGAAVLGGLFGLGELVSRYRDEPGRAATVLPSYVYISINAAVAVGSLALMRAFGWKVSVGANESSEASRLAEVLLAGLGAMAFLRTSLFTARIGNQDVGIGPSVLVQSLLKATDAAVDRRRGVARDIAIRRVMSEVSFEKAYQLLPSYCLALMQNLATEDQAALGSQIEGIVRMNSTDSAKARLLGLALMNAVGEEILMAAVESLAAEIKCPKSSAIEIKENLRTGAAV
ncbi:MAG TPA: hypothetical protein VGI81_14815 [Tepidisphaeraceae bacterium]|jgi:hypothetical protein